MPFPRRSDDRFGIPVDGFPTKNLFGQRRVGDQLRRITRSPWSDNGWNRLAGYLPASLNDLLDAETTPRP